MDTATPRIVIAGGGPVGLMLASELRLYGVETIVLERLTEIDRRAKAGGIQGRAAEMLDRRGLADSLNEARDKFMAELKMNLPPHLKSGGGPGSQPGGPGGKSGTGPGGAALMTRGHFAGMWALRESSYETAPGIFVPQLVLEQELERHAISQGVDLRRGHAITSYEQDGDGVTLQIDGPDGPYTLHAGWLVGADGGRSLVRKLGGFAFPGTDGIITGYQAVVELDDPEFAPRGWTRFPGGLMVNGPMPGRILCVEFDGPPVDRDSEITLDELQAAVRRITGTTVTLSSPTSLTRFTDNARLADDYRSGRVLLAGDAAHVHSPFGGQGLNLGLGDAVNLGWKLALVARGEAPDELLDTYTAERRPVAERVLDNTRAQVALMQPGPHIDALREIFIRMLDHDDANAYLTDLMNGADIRYDLDSRTDAVGRSYAFDLTVNTAEGEFRVADLMRSGRGLLIGDHDIAPWADRVDVVSGTAPKAPSCSLLIRPDGFVAWVTEEPTSLDEALTRWFGPGTR